MNFFDIWPLLAWLTTGTGIVALVAFVFFAPAVAARVGIAILNFLDQAIRKPLGAGVIAGALMFGLAWYWQGERMETLCNDRIEEMKQAAAAAATKRDAAITAATALKYTTVLKSLDDQANDLQQWVANYERQRLGELAAAPQGAGQCQLGADALRLRDRRR